MNETDYANATNLAKLRIAQYVVRSLFVSEENSEDQKTMLNILNRWVEKCESTVLEEATPST